MQSCYNLGLSVIQTCFGPKIVLRRIEADGLGVHYVVIAHVGVAFKHFLLGPDVVCGLLVSFFSFPSKFRVGSI